jgi:hypothetical protein
MSNTVKVKETVKVNIDKKIWGLNMDSFKMKDIIDINNLPEKIKATELDHPKYSHDINKHYPKCLGIFLEFITVENYFDDQPKRLSLADIELEKNYALILTTNAGLWAYSIGDTIKFVSKSPYRIKVTGRIKHFISAFGEHVIGEEVEYALMTAAKEINLAIAEFTVAPQVNPIDNGLPYHEWFIETAHNISDLPAFAARVDELLQTKNVYYKDLINGKVLRTLQIKILPSGTFINYMKKEGKLGGQNKVPRLSNDRKIADQLIG